MLKFEPRVPFVPTPPPCCGRYGCEVCGCTAERRAMRDYPPVIIGFDPGKEVAARHIPLSDMFIPQIPIPSTTLTEEKMRAASRYLAWRGDQQVREHIKDALIYGVGAVKVSAP